MSTKPPLKMMIPLHELLTDADHEYILAHGDHDGAAMESTRKRARARGWTEEQIRRHYPPCDCPGCTARRKGTGDAGVMIKRQGQQK
jgi:hypothetical protein